MENDLISLFGSHANFQQNIPVQHHNLASTWTPSHKVLNGLNSNIWFENMHFQIALTSERVAGFGSDKVAIA